VPGDKGLVDPATGKGHAIRQFADDAGDVNAWVIYLVCFVAHLATVYL
jgi:hypothetical protein